MHWLGKRVRKSGFWPFYGPLKEGGMTPYCGWGEIRHCRLFRKMFPMRKVRYHLPLSLVERLCPISPKGNLPILALALSELCKRWYYWQSCELASKIFSWWKLATPVAVFLVTNEQDGGMRLHEETLGTLNSNLSYAQATMTNTLICLWLFEFNSWVFLLYFLVAAIWSANLILVMSVTNLTAKNQRTTVTHNGI